MAKTSEREIMSTEGYQFKIDEKGKIVPVNFVENITLNSGKAPTHKTDEIVGQLQISFDEGLSIQFHILKDRGFFAPIFFKNAFIRWTFIILCAKLINNS